MTTPDIPTWNRDEWIALIAQSIHWPFNLKYCRTGFDSDRSVSALQENHQEIKIIVI